MKSDIIKKIALYFENRSEVVAAYLFGSYARDREKQSSDIDLGVLLEHQAFCDQKDLRTTYAIELGRLLRKDFHLVIMNNAGEGVMTQIFKHGKCIFERKPEILSRFKTVSYAMIAEFGYHRVMMEKAFVSRILGDSE